MLVLTPRGASARWTRAHAFVRLGCPVPPLLYLPLCHHQVYTPAAISALFSDFKQEVTLVLLFLKSVRSIEVMEVQAGQRQPQLLFSCAISNITPELLQQRALFAEAVSAPHGQHVAGTYRLVMQLRLGRCDELGCDSA